jgi:hypothetical protein
MKNRSLLIKVLACAGAVALACIAMRSVQRRKEVDKQRRNSKSPRKREYITVESSTPEEAPSGIKYTPVREILPRIDEIGNILIAGRVGSGKTPFLNNLADHYRHYAHSVVYTRFPAEWTGSGFSVYDSSKKDVKSILSEIQKNWFTEVNETPVLIILDGIHKFSTDSDDAWQLCTFLKLARKYNVHMLLCTQTVIDSGENGSNLISRCSGKFLFDSTLIDSGAFKDSLCLSEETRRSLDKVKEDGWGKALCIMSRDNIFVDVTKF